MAAAPVSRTLLFIVRGSPAAPFVVPSAVLMVLVCI